MELCIVNTTGLRVYCFTTEENKLADLSKAENARLKDIETWSKHCNTYPDREDLKGYLKDSESSRYEIMTYEQFAQLEKTSILNREMAEITEDAFYDALNVLPPIKWCTIDGVEMFCISEMWTGSYTNQYARKGDRYYTKMVDCLDKNTWIHNILN